MRAALCQPTLGTLRRSDLLRRRNAEICRLHAAGMSKPDIAAKFELTAERVRQILKATETTEALWKQS